MAVNEISMYRAYPTEKRHYINPTRERPWFFESTCDLRANLASLMLVKGYN